MDDLPAIALRFAGTAVYSLLLLAAAMPPLLGGEPFTCRFARRRTPAHLWTNPVFLEINRTMSRVWAGLFLLAALISLAPSRLVSTLLPPALLLAVGPLFNRRYPGYALRRLGLPPLPPELTASAPETFAVPGTPSAPAAPSPHGIAGAPGASDGAEARDEAPVDTPQPQAREKTIRVLALDSSPRADGQSKTRLVLEALVTGMRSAGAEVEVVPLRRKNVRTCIGCYTCWTKTPGVCVHQDDMTQELLPKWLAADLAVYATPLYHYTMNATLKAFIERTLPSLQPFFERRGDRTTHPERQALPAAVVVSVAGFPEAAVFDQLSAYVRFLFGERLLAEIYRPAAEGLVMAPGSARSDVLAAAEQAGRELVEGRRVAPDTLERITRPIGDPEAYLRIGNLMWKTCIAEGITPREFAERGVVPRPDSIEGFLTLLAIGFNPQGAAGIEAAIQFDFTGEVAGSCHIRVADGRIETAAAPAAKPALTITAPFGLWMDVITRKANPQQAFMTGKYKASGDLGLLMKMGTLFGR